MRHHILITPINERLVCERFQPSNPITYGRLRPSRIVGRFMSVCTILFDGQDCVEGLVVQPVQIFNHMPNLIYLNGLNTATSFGCSMEASHHILVQDTTHTLGRGYIFKCKKNIFGRPEEWWSAGFHLYKWSLNRKLLRHASFDFPSRSQELGIC